MLFLYILSIKKSLIALSPVVPIETKQNKANRINGTGVCNGICNSTTRLWDFQEKNADAYIGE